MSDDQKGATEFLLRGARAIRLVAVAIGNEMERYEEDGWLTGWLTGMDVPTDGWDEGDVWLWDGNERYQPWKDVAAFFRERADGK